MTKLLISSAAALVLVAAPIYAADVKTETQVEKQVETDDGTVKSKSTVESEKESDTGSTDTKVETKQEKKVDPLGGVEVQKKTETTTVD